MQEIWKSYKQILRKKQELTWNIVSNSRRNQWNVSQKKLLQTGRVNDNQISKKDTFSPAFLWDTSFRGKSYYWLHKDFLNFFIYFLDIPLKQRFNAERKKHTIKLANENLNIFTRLTTWKICDSFISEGQFFKKMTLVLSRCYIRSQPE